MPKRASPSPVVPWGGGRPHDTDARDETVVPNLCTSFHQAPGLDKRQLAMQLPSPDTAALREDIYRLARPLKEAPANASIY